MLSLQTFLELREDSRRLADLAFFHAVCAHVHPGALFTSSTSLASAASWLPGHPSSPHAASTVPEPTASFLTVNPPTDYTPKPKCATDPNLPVVAPGAPIDPTPGQLPTPATIVLLPATLRQLQQATSLEHRLTIALCEVLPRLEVQFLTMMVLIFSLN